MKNKILLAGLFVSVATLGRGQTPTETPAITPAEAAVHSQAPSGIPWKVWFTKNTIVTDKGDHVHFFWNAQDYKSRLEVKNRVSLLAQAAVELVKELYPAGATADLMKVDIVYVTERDNYGMPKWDSLSRVAHLEFSRASFLKVSTKALKGPEEKIKGLFTDFEILE